MGQVTGLTKEKTLELLAQGITGAHLSGYNLILHRDNYDPDDPDTYINLGNIRGPVGATGGVTLTEVQNDVGNTGKGCIALDTSNADDSLGSTEDVHVPLAGLLVALVPVVGRTYEVKFTAPLQSDSGLVVWDLDLVEYATDFSNTGATHLIRAGSFQGSAGRTVQPHGSYTFTATSTTEMRLGLTARFSVNDDARVNGTDFPAIIAVIDHGVI